MFRAITFSNLRETGAHSETPSVWPCREICVPDNISGHTRFKASRELLSQLGFKAPKTCLTNCAGVMGHEIDNRFWEPLLAQPPRPIQWVKPCLRQCGCVPDVVKPTGRGHNLDIVGFQQPSSNVVGLGANRLHMSPPTRQRIGEQFLSDRLRFPNQRHSGLPSLDVLVGPQFRGEGARPAKPDQGILRLGQRARYFLPCKRLQVEFATSGV